MRNAPSMTSLRAFAALLRHGTLSGAARELCVTPAAISHRLRDLEQSCGQKLVYREGGRFRATDLGQNVADRLGDAFERIRNADALLRSREPPPLRIIASYSFAVLWLTPRLQDFEALHPDAQLHIEPSHDPISEETPDVLIVHSDRCPSKGRWIKLFDDTCAVMGRAEHPLLNRTDLGLEELLGANLVHIAHKNGAHWGEFSWHQWREKLRLRTKVPQTGAHVTAEHLAVDMILEQNRLALISVVNAANHVSKGRLRVVPGSSAASDCSYWAGLPEKPEGNHRLAMLFVNWLADRLKRPL